MVHICPVHVFIIAGSCVKKELDDQLCQKFPNLYRDRNKHPVESPMHWGFECGDGWFKLIYDLSEELEAEILKLPESERENYCASQVKEKYGTLRFYMTKDTPKMREIIIKYENISAETCERCGSSGTTRGQDWYVTLCDSCFMQKG